jgi:uncharacterized protein YdeI (YjbR/CyaY-like superfamily)
MISQSANILCAMISESCHMRNIPGFINEMTMQQKAPETFCPASRQEWRDWLTEHHRSKQSIWLVYYKKDSGIPTVSYSDAVDEALCFGWIDSTKKTLGPESFMQLFARRKPTSVWSKINKGKVEQLIAGGLMTAAGHECIQIAQQNGSWTILDEAEDLTIPKDLLSAFKAHPGSKAFYTGLSKSSQKSILQWLLLAKRPETRQKRIDEIATLAALQLKPKQFR